MTKNEVGEDIRFIREMLDRTKALTAQSWKYFFVWGVVVILAIIGMYVLVFMEKHQFIWLNWMVFTIIGGILSGILGIKEGERGAVTYAQKVIVYLVISGVVGFVLTSFIFPMLKLYDYGVISVMVSLIAGMLVFSLGGIYQVTFLLWAGVFWWLGAIGMIFVADEYRAMISIPLLIFGYLLPGYVLSKKYKNEITNHG